MNLDKGAERRFDTSIVPENLRRFVPIIKRLGFREQGNQDEFARQLSDSRPNEAAELLEIGLEVRSILREWNTELTGGEPAKIALLADDETHPYWAFDDALSVIDVLDAGELLTPEAQARANKEALHIRFGDVSGIADEHFRNQNYDRYVEVMEPFETILNTSQQAKLRIARSRLQ